MRLITPSRVGLVVALALFARCGENPAFKEEESTRYRPPAGVVDGGDAGGVDAQGANAQGLPGGPDSGDAGDAGDVDGGDAGAVDGGTDATADGGAEGGADGGNPAGTEDPIVLDQLRRLPKFGLLVNDLECGLCHVSVVGDVASTRRVPPLWTTSNVAVTGRWLAASAFDAAASECAADPAAYCRGSHVTVNVAGGILKDYRGNELPSDRTGDGTPDFPVLDFDQVKTKVGGTVTTQGAFAATTTGVHTGNLVLTGTMAQPIVIKGDLFITGDLVIKGYYTGVGTIYATGNIYVPADLRAVRSAFPYSDDEGQALAKAKDQVAKQSADALGLATNGSIFIGDLQKQQTSDAGNEALTVYNHPSTPANRRGEALGTLNVFNWFPGGAAGFNALYENAVSCVTQTATQTGSFNMIEGFLYAKNTIAGISRRASFTIRGGVIADYFHVVSGASRCAGAASPVHGRPSNRSYIEYDFRLRTGQLRVLEHVGSLFPAP